jgi:hypothetical protein
VINLVKKRRLLKAIAGIIVILVILVIINFIPTWNLKLKDMHKLEGNCVNVFYETEEEAAKDVFELADSKAEEISEKLGFSSKQDVAIYIYDHQSTMQTKKYGLIAPLLGLDWYIGDNIGTNVILTSPANPGKVHNYDNNKFAVLHEMVHAYVSILNPHIRLWLTEGLALYLSNGEPFYKSYLNSYKLPSFSDIQTKNPIKFSDIGGYNLAHTYIEYLEVTYGWDKVLELIKTEDYTDVFGVSEEEIYLNWIDYLKNYDQCIE